MAIALAKTHPAVFYTQVYTKLLPYTVQAKVNATVDNGEGVDAALRRIVNGLIAARQDGSQGYADAEPMNLHRIADVLSPKEFIGIVGGDTDGYSDKVPTTPPSPPHEIYDGVTYTRSTNPNLPTPATPNVEADAQRNVARAAAEVAKPNVVRSSHNAGGSTVPGLYAGVALDEGCDENLSTTERFYLWNGHGRPP